MDQAPLNVQQKRRRSISVINIIIIIKVQVCVCSVWVINYCLHTTSKDLTGTMKLGFFFAFCIRDEDNTCPAHSMSILGLSTDWNCSRFRSRTPQNNTFFPNSERRNRSITKKLGHQISTRVFQRQVQYYRKLSISISATKWLKFLQNLISTGLKWVSHLPPLCVCWA